MKQAKQQAQDLRQTDDFLKAVSKPGGAKLEGSQIHRQMNGRSKITRVDSLSRFSDPPAPPPQQPLPEKPDAVPRTGADAFSVLKRSDTEKPKSPSNSASSPPRETSQILSLIEALTSARREIDTHCTRVKELEGLLHKERSAREWAETKVKKAEGRCDDDQRDSIETNGFLSPDEGEKVHANGISVSEKAREPLASTLINGTTTDEQVDGVSTAEPKTKNLERRLQMLMEEMEEMRQQVASFKQRAQREESEKLEARKSLGEMIDALRRERAYNVAHGKTITSSHDLLSSHPSVSKAAGMWESEDGPLQRCLNANYLPQTKEMAAALTREGRHHNLLETCSPYASMLGVILLGVGLMAYLNEWQKIEK